MAEVSDDHIREIVRGVLNGRLDKIADDQRAFQLGTNERLGAGNQRFKSIEDELKYQRSKLWEAIDGLRKDLGTLPHVVETQADVVRELKELHRAVDGLAVPKGASLRPDWLAQQPRWLQYSLALVVVLVLVNFGVVDRGDVREAWQQVERVWGGGAKATAATSEPGSSAQ